MTLRGFLVVTAIAATTMVVIALMLSRVVQINSGVAGMVGLLVMIVLLIPLVEHFRTGSD